MQATLVNAVLYGRLEGVPPETIFLFARTGLVHLFSASGFHMSMAVILAQGVARVAAPLFPTARGPAAAGVVLSLAMMLFFGAKTEWSSPMVRAFSFAAILSTAKLLEVRPTAPWVFALSLAASALFGRGSWLSFALSACGMAGLLYVRPRNLFTLALAPWATSLPLCTWYFQLFAGAAPLWNLTVGAAIGLTVLPLAIVHLVLESAGFSPPALLALAEWLMSFLVALLERGDRLVGLSFWVTPHLFFPLLTLLLFALHLAPRKARSAAAIGAAGAAVALFFPVPSLASLRVGQGDATFFETAAGGKILVDTGPPGFRGKEAASARSLERLGLAGLDEIFFSHLDRDHVGGTASVLARHPVRGAAWMRPEHLADPKALNVLAALERAAVPLRFYTANPAPGLRCWLPPATGSNESSAICRASLRRGRSVWLTGDAGFPSERWLLEQGPLPHGDFLKVAHHGSRFSSGGDFLAALGAKEALVSVGRNRYGHPSPEAVKRLREAGMRVHRTDEEGTITYW
jgi:competence protein ComEC